MKLKHDKRFSNVADSCFLRPSMEAPILVHGRKFDIRQYALVTPDGVGLCMSIPG